jgi:hypothetical protein
MSSALQYTYRRISYNIPIGTTDIDLYTGNFNYIYREDTNATDVNIRLNARSESLIVLRSQTAIDIGSGGADKLILEVTSAVAFTLVVIIGDSERSNDLTGVSIRRDSTETTVTGTIDVDITAQTLPVLNENIAQINGSATAAADCANYFDINNPDNTAVTGWTYLNTGSTTILSATADTYITSCNVSCFGLTSVDNTIFLTHYNAAAAIVNVLLVFTFNQALTANTNPDGTFGLSQQFPIPYKLTSGEFIRIVGGVDTWSSGSVQAVTV